MEPITPKEAKRIYEMWMMDKKSMERKDQLLRESQKRLRFCLDYVHSGNFPRWALDTDDLLSRIEKELEK